MAQTFDPYGNPYAYTGPTASPTSYGFTGEQTDSNGLVFLRARYYAPSMGRFMQMDPSRQEMNPYLYAIANPVMFTDKNGLYPSGAEDTARRIIKDNRAMYSDLGALIALFVHPDLDKIPGFSSHLASDRLDFILDITASANGWKGQFAIDFGDTGFDCAYKDSWLYDQNNWSWHRSPGKKGPLDFGVKSNQVGHFLTAVRLAYDTSTEYIEVLRLGLLGMGSTEAFTDNDIFVPLKLAIGHELRSDDSGPLTIRMQYESVTEQDIMDFLSAVAADGLGLINERDQKIRDIFFRGGFYDQQGQFTHYSADSAQWRQGNSINDLLLTVKGWRFGSAIWWGHDIDNTPLITRKEAARWLSNELMGGN